MVWGSSCVAVVQISGLPGVGSENQKSSFLVFLSRSFIQSSMESQISTRSPTSHASPLFNLQLAAYDSVSGSVQAFETPRLHSFSISFSCSPKWCGSRRKCLRLGWFELGDFGVVGFGTARFIPAAIRLIPESKHCRGECEKTEDKFGNTVDCLQAFRSAQDQAAILFAMRSINLCRQCLL